MSDVHPQSPTAGKLKSVKVLSVPASRGEEEGEREECAS